MDRKQKMEIVIVAFLGIMVILYHAVPEMREITENIMKVVAVVTLVCVLMRVDSWFGGHGGNSYSEYWDDGNDCDCDGDCDCD